MSILNKPYIGIILGIQIILLSCNDGPSNLAVVNNVKSVSFNMEMNEQHLEPIIYKKVNGSLSRFLFQDSIVYFSDYHNTHYILNVLNIYSDTNTIHRTIPFGTGPKELSYVNDLSLVSDTIVQIVDRNINRIFQFSINDIKYRQNPDPHIALFIKDYFPKEPIQISSNKWLSNLLVVGDFKSQFILFDSLQQVQETDIAYPKIDRKFQYFFLPEVFNCSICYNEADQIMAVAYYHMELIELITTKDTLRKILTLTGDRSIQPNFEPVTTDEGAMILEWTDDVHEVFFSIQCNREYVFVAYRDPTKPVINESWLDTILVMDWEGNLISRLKLSVPITGLFDVDFENNQILAVSEVDDKGFVLYEYDKFVRIGS